MTGTMTWAAMDVHARSTYAGSLDVITGELCRQRFDTGAVEPVVGYPLLFMGSKRLVNLPMLSDSPTTRKPLGFNA